MKPGIGLVEEPTGSHIQTMLDFTVQQQHDPNETLHLWEADLPPREREAFGQLKDSTAIRDSIREAFPGCDVHHVDAMNEVYVTHMGAKGSDYVFLQRHIDGPFGFIPFLTLLRCLIVIRGSDRVTTVFENHKSRTTLASGQFCWFDYNRDLHHIVKDGDAQELLTDSRICLKVHYAVAPRWLRPVHAAFAAWNAAYNRRARQLFLASKNPRTWLGKLLGVLVNASTFLYGLFNEHAGVLNLLVILLLGGVTWGHPVERVYLFSFVHYLLYLLAYTFRAVEPGKLRRDASLFQTLALGFLFYEYAGVPLDIPSLGVAALGFGLSGLAFLRLGADRTYFGVELGVVPKEKTSGFPYSVIPHPMIVGKWIGLAGLMMNATFRAAWWPLLIAHMACYLIVLCQEIGDWHVGGTYRFEETYEAFSRFHRRPGNVSVHLLTTALGLLGVLGLVGVGARALGWTPAAAAVCLAVYYVFFCYYTAPDHTASMSALYAGAVLGIYLALPPLGWPLYAGLLVFGTLAQEASHVAFRERTYMSSYQGERGAAKQLLLHSLLLVPLLCRARFFASLEVPPRPAPP